MNPKDADPAPVTQGGLSRQASHALRAVLISIGLHLLGVAAVAAYGVWQGLPLLHKPNLELVAVSIEDLKELPLGAPPTTRSGGGQDHSDNRVVRPRKRPKPKPSGTDKVGGNPDAGMADAGVTDARPGDAAYPPTDAPGGGDAGRKRARDLRAYGPEGSRVTAILRLDRMRAAPEAKETIAAVDGLLRLLPDRRRLVEGTGLDLYRDFDVLLIATPNPLDDAVTFLAARHHVKDDVLQAALAKGAATAGRPLTWTLQDGRPVGARATPTGKADRDDRLFVLPQAGLAVMAPPAYATLLLPGKNTTQTRGTTAFKNLIERINAQDSAVPDDAVLMLTAVNLWRVRAGGGGTAVVRDAEGPMAELGGDLPLPVAMTLLSGLSPQPYVEVTIELADAAGARVWEPRLLAYKQKLLGNPLLLLGGWTGLLSRLHVERENERIIVRTTSSAVELRRILTSVSTLIDTARAARH